MKLFNFNEFILESSDVKVFRYKIYKEEPIDNLEKYKEHRRLKVFYYKGTKCVNCERVGTRLIHTKDRFGNTHIDVYTDDLHPITVDHIVPKSKGGSNRLKNLQPMCSDCNREKGDGERVYKKRGYNKKKLNYKKRYDINIGDTVYKNRTGELLGEVIDIVENPKHPKNALSVRIKERDYESLYSLRSIHKKA